MAAKIKVGSSFIEPVYIFIALFFFLYLGFGNHFGNSLTHPFPYGYMANDAFWQLTIAQTIYNTGNLRFMPLWASAGFRDVVGFYPPALGQLTAALSYLVHVEVYDSVFIISHFFVIISILTFYIIVRKVSRDLAILSLPLSVLYYSSPFFISMTFGELSFLLGAYYLLVFFWALGNLEYSVSIIALTVSTAGMIHAHFSEFLFGLVFLLLYSLWRFFFRELDPKTVKKLGVCVLLGIFISLYFLIIFKFTFMVWQPYSFKPTLAKYFTGWRAVTFGSFGIVSPNIPAAISKIAGFMLPSLILIGILLSLMYLLKRNSYPFIVSGFILLVGYTNLIGAMNRAFQTRFMWPVYFGLFLGTLFYTIIRQMVRRPNIIISIFIGLCLISILASVYLIPIRGPGLMEIYHWNSLKWLGDNTPEDSRVYLLYSPAYEQGVPTQAHRPIWIMTHDAFIEALQALQKGTVSRNYSTYHTCLYDGGLAYRKSLLDLGYHLIEDKDYILNNDFLPAAHSRDICRFDYYVYDKQSNPEVISQYHRFLVDIFMKSGWFEEVYSNDVVGILKNKKSGDDCLGALFQNETE